MLRLLLLLSALSISASAAPQFPFSFWKPSSSVDANTQLLISFDNGSTIVDRGVNNLSSGWSITAAGVVNGTNPKFGAGSWNGYGPSHNGNTYLVHAGNSAFTFGSGDFTIDFWVYWRGTAGEDLMGIHTAGANDWNIGCVGVGGTTFYFRNGNTDVAACPAVSADTWHHMAVVRSSGTVKCYVDGTAGTGASDSTNYNDTATALRIGANDAFRGDTDSYIDELRISNVARWTSNFTPPTGPY